MPEADIFSSEQPTVDQIIGDNGKYKTVEDAAKALLEKDRFIEQLKTENKQARDALSKVDNVETLVKELQTKLSAAPPAVKPQEPTGSSAPSAISEKDLVERIKQVTREQSVEERRASNVNSVAEKLVEVYGSTDKAKEVVAQKARDLGVSTEFLQQTAAQSPAGFYTLMGIQAQSQPAAQALAPRERVNTEALGRTKTGGEPEPDTWAYFDKIRQTNMREYLSPKVQNRMHKMALENPEKFGAPEVNW